ncbi:MAG: DUF4153 domain-containing protein [Granulosicoccus sp.]
MQDSDIAGNTTPGSLVWQFLLPGLIQGAALYWLLEWVDDNQYDIRLLALTWFLAIAPLAHHLVTTEGHRRSSITMSVVLGALCALLAWGMASRFGWGEASVVSTNYPIPQAVFCSIVICVVALPFYRTRIQRQAAWNDYPTLFEFSWNQTVSAVVGGGFMLVVFAVLGLTIALFDVLGFDLEEILWRREVLMPIAGGAFGLGVGITRTRHAIVHGTRYLLISLLRALLPVHVLVTGGFVLVAAFQGLDAIDTGISVTFVLLLAVALALTLCSAAVGDTEKPDGRVLGWLCRVQSVLVLFMSLLAVWALWQRIDQYGLTQDRLLAAVLVSVFFLYGATYAATVFVPAQARALQQINIVMALLTMIVAMLLMTPLLDLPSIAARQQIARLGSGELLTEEVDLGWLRFDAGLAGVDALDRLRELPLARTETMRSRLADLDSSENKRDYYALLLGQDERAELFSATGVTSVYIIRPTADDADSDRAADRLFSELASMPIFDQLCIEKTRDCAIVETDVLKTGSREYLVAIRGSKEVVWIDWFVEADDKNWLLYRGAMIWEAFSSATHATPAEIDTFFKQLKSGEPMMVPVTLPALLVGDQQLVPGITGPHLHFQQ